MELAQHYQAFTKKYPEKTLKLNNGDFTFRYAKHPTSKVTLILLAGGMGIGDGFFRHFEALAEYFSVITFNYSPSFRTNTQLAQAFALLIRRLDLQNVYLVGQSYGGFLAQIIAKYYPNLIKGMVLSNTGTLTNTMSYDGFENLYLMLKKSEKFAKLDQFLPIMILRPILKAGIHKKCKHFSPENQKQLHLFSDIVFIATTNAHLLLMDTLLADLKNEWHLKPEDFASYENEVLLLLSDDDKTFTDSVKEALIHLMPSPVYDPSISGGHLAPLVQFDAYITAIINFINERNQTTA